MGKSVTVSTTGLKKRGLQFIAKAGGIKGTDEMTVLELKEHISKLKGKAADTAASESTREKSLGN